MRNNAFTLKETLRISVSYYLWVLLYAILVGLGVGIIVVIIGADFFDSLNVPSSLQLIISLAADLFINYFAFRSALKKTYKRFRIELLPPTSKRYFLFNISVIFSLISLAFEKLSNILTDVMSHFFYGVKWEHLMKSENIANSVSENGIAPFISIIILLVILLTVLVWFYLYFILNRSYKTIEIKKELKL